MSDGPAAIAEGVLGMEETPAASPCSGAEMEAWTMRFGAVFEALDGGPDEVPPAGVWDAIDAALGPKVLQRRADEGAWFPLGPGASMKMLMVDPPTGSRTALVRLDAGTLFPAHDHDQFEECLVLEGGLEIDGQMFRAGDYILAAAASRHRDIPCPGGALVLLRWESPRPAG